MDSKGSAASAGKMLASQGDASLANFREDVLWGGVYYFGNKPDGDEMPYCAKAVPAFQAELSRRFAQLKAPHFNLILDQSARQAPLVMVVSMTSENPYERPDPLLQGQTRMELDIRAQLLVLDPKADMQVVNAYPLGMRAVDSVMGAPMEANWTDLASYGLCEELRDENGKPISIITQVVDTITRQAVATRSLWAPISVSSVTVDLAKPAASPYGELRIDQTLSTSWAKRFGTSFTTYLAKNSGFPLNPFLNAGDDRFDRDSTIGGALQLTRRSSLQPTITGKLRKPEQLITLVISDLTMRTVELRTGLLESVEYGCTIELQLHDTTSATLRAAASITPAKLGEKSAPLARKIAQVARYNYDPAALREGSVDHAKAYCRYIENLLNILSNCIAHEEDDPAGLFTAFRKAMNRN